MAKRAKGKRSTAKDAQVPPTRQTGPESATGAALRDQEHEAPKGADRGSKVPIEGGAPKPDVEGPKAVGAQKEPARFTSNGQLPHMHLPSPTGAVPAGATGLSPEDARERHEQAMQSHEDFVNRRVERKRIDAATLQRLNPVELRAIADQRGYDLPEAGTRATRQAFIEAQDADAEIARREASRAKARR